MRYLALLALVLFLVGCGEKDEPETQASKDAASASASTWTPEQKAAMQEAIKHRRDSGSGVNK